MKRIAKTVTPEVLELESKLGISLQDLRKVFKTKKATSIYCTTKAGAHGEAEVYCQYHDTIVFTYCPALERVILNNGGYFSATTKVRMNQMFDLLKLPFRVYQFKGQWFVQSYLDWSKTAWKVGFGEKDMVSFNISDHLPVVPTLDIIEHDPADYCE